MSIRPYASPSDDSREHNNTTAQSSFQEQPRLFCHGLLAILTVLGLAIITIVVGLMTLAWVLEGDDPFASNGGANIGLGLLLLAVMLNVPIWCCWIVSSMRGG